MVAEGVEFTDGSVAMRWVVGTHPSTVLYDEIEAVEEVHGHGGRTRLVWVDGVRHAGRGAPCAR